nr:MAG TPA: hypothetical protein [Caudoviricetes sp.]
MREGRGQSRPFLILGMLESFPPVEDSFHEDKRDERTR